MTHVVPSTIRVSQHTNTLILGKLHPAASMQCIGAGEIIKKATKRFALKKYAHFGVC